MVADRLLKHDWEKDHVYLITYPRCRTIPNISPWSLKLETWLRVAGLKYTGISNELKKFSSKGQVPFIEYNGRSIGDSNIIIETLAKERNLSQVEPSKPRDVALTRAITALTEDHLLWTIFSLRSRDFSWAATDDGWGRYLGTGLKRTITVMMLKKKMKKIVIDRCKANGMGRHLDSEIEHFAQEDLKALSVLLEDKSYFLGGDSPTTLDCTVFGHLAGFLYIPTPNNNALTNYIKNTTPNLAAFVERMKERYWPDWEETCQSMDMNVHHRTLNEYKQ